MRLAPIVLFVYNRPAHTRETLNALAANSLAGESDLYIYADGPKADASAELIAQVNETRKVIREKRWCRQVSIVESEVNHGLANSIINGVTEVINKHGLVIVLEDDLVTHPFFLTYMNHYLEVYRDVEKVISVHGFMYPIKKKLSAPFFLKGADCWGWGTWKRGWDLFEPNGQRLLDELLDNNFTKEFDFDGTYKYTSLLRAQVEGKVDSWAIRWYASAFLLNKLTLYPPTSLVENIGFDGSGTHGDMLSESVPRRQLHGFELTTAEISENKRNKKQIGRFFKGDAGSIKGFIRKVRSIYVRKN